MLPKFQLEHESETPLYQQLYEQMRAAILDGRIVSGDRIPASRELAGSLGLNRSTIALAFERLEAEGLIRSHVGKGTFVESPEKRIDWAKLTPVEDAEPVEIANAIPPDALISFSASRPSKEQFP